MKHLLIDVVQGGFTVSNQERIWPLRLTALALAFFFFSSIVSVAQSQEQLCNQLASDRDDISSDGDNGGLWDYEVNAKSALAACEKALSDTSNRARTLYQIGRTHALLGDEKQARRSLQAAAELQYPRAFSRLAELTTLDKYNVASGEELSRVYDLCKTATQLGDLAGPQCIMSMRMRYMKYGVGINPDQSALADAIKRLTEFAAADQPTAQYAIATALILRSKDPVFATVQGSPRPLLEEAAEAGHRAAMGALGIVLTAQRKRDDSYYVGIQWLKKAASLGDEASSSLLADLCGHDTSVFCK